MFVTGSRYNEAVMIELTIKEDFPIPKSSSTYVLATPKLVTSI